MFRTWVLVTAVALSAAPFALAQDTLQSGAKAARGGDDDGVQRAIQFQRLKDREDALQGRKESRHPQAHNYSAGRRAENSSTVKDPGPAPGKTRKKIQ